MKAELLKCTPLMYADESYTVFASTKTRKALDGLAERITEHNAAVDALLADQANANAGTVSSSDAAALAKRLQSKPFQLAAEAVEIAESKIPVMKLVAEDHQADMAACLEKLNKAKTDKRAVIEGIGLHQKDHPGLFSQVLDVLVWPEQNAVQWAPLVITENIPTRLNLEVAERRAVLAAALKS